MNVFVQSDEQSLILLCHGEKTKDKKPRYLRSQNDTFVGI